MRRVLIIIGVIIVVALAGVYGYISYTETQQSAPTAAQDIPIPIEDDLDNVIWASGRLEPVRWAELSTVSGGTVSQIDVTEGQWVESNLLLLSLDTTALESEVVRAAAAMAEAGAALSKLRSGATTAEIAAAEANLAAAQANQSLASGRLLEIQSSIAAARAQVQIVQAQYNELASHPTGPESTAAAAEVAIAEATVRQAQAAFNVVKGDPQIGSLPQSLALMQATASLEAAKARSTVTAGGPTSQQLAVIQAQINAAQAQVAVAESQVSGIEAGVRSAQAQVDSTQAALNKLLAGATSEDIAVAEARVQSAQAAVASAQVNLHQGQIRAPFEGQVGAIYARTGEQISPNETAILFGDTRQMHIKTTDLRETDVIYVTEGMGVEVTFDALPDDIFAGTVTHIAPVSSAERGSTNYTVNIELGDELDERLLWGMTAFVNIKADK
ncbi:MAG: HlyD family efflux transporter periplasmic adaptor subunit [Chloroflexota bacterium]